MTPQPRTRLPANVCVTLMQDPDGAVPAGGVFTYTLTVKNTGPGTAFDTGVRIPLDPNVEVLDFKSNDSSIFVDYVGDDAVSVLFHEMGNSTSAQAWIIARVRPEAADTTKMATHTSTALSCPTR
jgi:uncharacterized repeat protein (TIGR01451 family)